MSGQEASDEVFINEALLENIFTDPDVEPFEEEKSIEDIIDDIEVQNNEKPSIIMLKDEGSSGKKVMVKFPEGNDDKSDSPGPIVVINIRWVYYLIPTNVKKTLMIFTMSELRMLILRKNPEQQIHLIDSKKQNRAEVVKLSESMSLIMMIMMVQLLLPSMWMKTCSRI